MSEIRAQVKPVMFKLVDLQNDEVSGNFYREQLTKSPPPQDQEYFLIEKILGKKTIKGKKHVLVKYLYYPNKFNRYIPEENIVRGNDAN